MHSYLPRLGWQRCLAATLLALGVSSAWAQSLQVTANTELRARPQLNARIVQRMEPGQALEQLEAQGGWLRVKLGAQEGWVRSTHVQTASAAPAQGGSGAAAGLAGIFSAASTKPTATTGTRGLTQEQLANATPNPAEVQQLERYATSAEQARKFSQMGKLQERRIDNYTGAEQ